MIDVNQIVISLSHKEIVHGVDMKVGKGQFVGIIGPNGSGKSTLLKAVYRVIKADKGTIYIDGENIEDVSLTESALKTAVVTQHNFYNFDFGVGEVVLMGRSPHKKSMEMDNAEDRRIADDALAKVGMTEFRDRNFSTLSGGEQQRVVLARALTQQTPCLLLDEPTNHLDIKYQLQLMDIVKALDVTVLCALHDLNIASQYCDILYLMKDGKVYTYGTSEEVLTEENIKNVYGVDAVVSQSKHTGHLNIEYLPKHTVEKYEIRDDQRLKAEEFF